MISAINEIGENEQIRVFPDQKSLGGLRLSKFHDAAIHVATRQDLMIGPGDKINVLEDALAAAYARGYADRASRVVSQFE